jgi:hypothetical protein
VIEIERKNLQVSKRQISVFSLYAILSDGYRGTLECNFLLKKIFEIVSCITVQRIRFVEKPYQKTRIEQ